MAKIDARGMIAVLCSELLFGSLVGCGRHRVTLPEAKPAASTLEPLQEDLKKSYLTLFEEAPKLEYSESQIAKMRQYLGQAQDYCVGRFEASVASMKPRRG